jgi:formate dehydrogenase subunit gamma
MIIPRVISLDVPHADDVGAAMKTSLLPSSKTLANLVAQALASCKTASLMFAVSLVCVASLSTAQAQDKAAVAVTPVAAPMAVASALQSGGNQSANINDVKPDASASPNYSKETAGERARSQPGNNAPIWRDVRHGVGVSSLPGAEQGVLIQADGQWWRTIRNGLITVYGGWALLAVMAAIAAFYWYRGTIKLSGPRTGKVIERFTYAERAAHWSVAITFVLLAVSGLVMLFGKYILLPVMGGTLFGWLTYLLKNIHNFVGPVFAVSLVFVFVKFVKDNLPRAGDLKWLLKGGGLLNGEHVSSHRFNAGEKIWFWLGVFALGIVVSASGFVLDKIIPGLQYTRGDMQLAHIIHAVATIVMMAFAMGHIYIGTKGTEGAYEGMRTGYVDEAWAKDHHDQWYQDVKTGKIPAIRTPESERPAPAAALLTTANRGGE